MIKKSNKSSERFPILSLLITLLFLGSLFTRCATVGTPTGGDKDTIPPIIMSIDPGNYSTNMDTLAKKIYIEFNEFVQLVDQSKEFYTSPKMKYTPQLTIRGRGVVVTLRDTMKPNTTYALNFGSTIRDNNEANPLNSMRYVFSTGDEIDSMIVSGYAEDSYKADSASKTLIYFYPVDSISRTEEYDSTIFNSTPAVIARAENNGVFIAQNLKPIDYWAYAVYDSNNNFLYEPGTDKIGFFDSLINPTKLNDFGIWYDTVREYVVADPQLHFRIFTDVAFKRQMLMESKRPLQHQALLYFTSDYPQIDSIVFDSIPSDKVIIESITDGNDTLSLWFDMPAEMLPDTIKGSIYYYKHDSIRELVQVEDKLKLAWKFYESKEARQEREKREKELEKAREKAEENGEEWVEPEEEEEVKNPFVISYPTTTTVNPESSFTMNFKYPIRSIDSAAIRLRRMSAEEAVIAKEMELKASSDSTIILSDIYRGVDQPFRLHRDTQNIRQWYIDPEWSANETDHYYLEIPKGTITNILDESNDSIVQRFELFKVADYATIIVDILPNREDESKYIVELINAGNKVVIESKEGISSGRLTFNYVSPGDVSIRVLQDRNGNGKWDSGDMVNRRQPEMSKVYSKDGDSNITTKANWEVSIQIDPKEMFAPESAEQLAERLRQQEIDRLADIEYKRLLKESGGA